MRGLLLLIFLCLGCFGSASKADSGSDFTLYLVRHAEKQLDGSRDPFLDEAGTSRAEKLSGWFQDKSIRDIWSSDFHRTRDTVKPLLSSIGLELTIYDPRQLADLSGKLLNRQNNALVVGHSNTTPELARLLCGCDIDPMDETEHDRLIVVSIVDGEPSVTTLHQSRLFR